MGFTLPDLQGTHSACKAIHLASQGPDEGQWGIHFRRAWLALPVRSRPAEKVPSLLARSASENTTPNFGMLPVRKQLQIQLWTQLCPVAVGALKAGLPRTAMGMPQR